MDPLIFARNLRQLVQRSGHSRQVFAGCFGFDYKTLCRLMTKGTIRPPGETRRALEMVCQTFGLRYEDLWAEQPEVEACLAKMREVLHIWRDAGMSFSEAVDHLLVAARLAQRFRIEEREVLVRRVCQAFGIEPHQEAELHSTLQREVKGWLSDGTNPSEDELYHRLRHWAVDLKPESGSG